ncbi:MAG: hypothetical protein CMG46_12370 [Candidatus Marinimicrobia bacterium]|nr:hypothetical protein [Candidatus Neomarinimicrobiota bacterium]
MSKKIQSRAGMEKKDSALNLLAEQSCGKCGAEFLWEPSSPKSKGSPLVARLSKPSDKCDCGYGAARPELKV